MTVELRPITTENFLNNPRPKKLHLVFDDEVRVDRLDELLEDWKIHVSLPYEGIRVAGTLWSPRAHQVKNLIKLNRIQYQWLDVEKDLEAAALCKPGEQLEQHERLGL